MCPVLGPLKSVNVKETFGSDMVDLDSIRLALKYICYSKYCNDFDDYNNNINQNNEGNKNQVDDLISHREEISQLDWQSYIKVGMFIKYIGYT